MFIILFATTTVSAGVKKHSPNNPRLRRMLALARSAGMCPRAITGENTILQITESRAFQDLARPALVSGTRRMKLLVTKMADKTIQVAYGPMTMGIFLTPASGKLSDYYTISAIAQDDQAKADETHPIRALWIGEIETQDGVLIRATYRDLKDQLNDEDVMMDFISSALCPWAIPANCRPTKLRSHEYHLMAFMNLPGALTYTHYYDQVGNALSSVYRSFDFVQLCLDRGDLACAQTEFRKVARLARDGQVSDSRNGLILDFEGLAREDGFGYPNEKNQDRFKQIVENAAVNTEHTTREDMEFFRSAISRLSTLINLSRPNTQPQAKFLEPLIYILQDGGVGVISPEYE